MFISGASQRAKIASKIRDEYAAVKDFKLPERTGGAAANGAAEPTANGVSAAAAAPKSTTAKLIESMPEAADQ